MESITHKDNSLNLISQLKKEGYYSGTLSNSIHQLIVKSVYKDILKKAIKFKNLNDNSNSFMELEKKVLTTLELFNKNELQECFGPLSSRYLCGNTVAIEISKKLKEYFYSLYKINFSFNGIRDFDRKKILPNVSESDTVAIFYRIYAPNTECGFPHRDSDFWKIDKDLPKIPFKNSSRVKFWMPVVGCNSLNSLRIWPNSHRKNIKTQYIEGQYRKSPYIDLEDLNKIGNYVVPASEPKYFTFFDDKTIHHGPKNINNDKFGFRISLESNLFIDSKLL